MIFYPLHTDCPSKILLKSQEKDHVHKNSLKFNFLGEINNRSPYVSNKRTFSYIISKTMACLLINLIQVQKIDCELDDWFIRLIDNKIIKNVYFYLSLNNLPSIFL